MFDLIGRAKAAVLTLPDLTPIPGEGNVPVIKTMITNIVLFIVWLAGALAVAYLVYGGILYITAGGDAEKATKGKTAIINAIIGIIIVFGALIIISWIKKSLDAGTPQF